MTNQTYLKAEPGLTVLDLWLQRILYTYNIYKAAELILRKQSISAQCSWETIEAFGVEGLPVGICKSDASAGEKNSPT